MSDEQSRSAFLKANPHARAWAARGRFAWCRACACAGCGCRCKAEGADPLRVTWLLSSPAATTAKPLIGHGPSAVRLVCVRPFGARLVTD